MADEYEVGYGKPPRRHQFKPGVSGNPRGRPKGARGFKSMVEEALSAKVTLTEGTKKRRVPIAFAALTRLMQKALAGDLRALEKVLSLAQMIDADRPVPIASPDENDLAVIDVLRRTLLEDRND